MITLPFLRPAFRVAAFPLIVVTVGLVAAAGERRAAAPRPDGQSFRGTFFKSADEAFRSDRPLIGEVIAPAPAASPSAAAAPSAAASGGESAFTSLISPASLEDEIKRLRLEFESVITTPAAFKSGDFQKARLHLSILAALFAVIVEHEGDVRWKRDAAAARDLFARSAMNCKSGSLQVYNEVKLRKDDLDDLVSGSGLANRQAEAENDWVAIVDRVPLMNYAEYLLEEPLKEGSRSAEAVQAEGERLRRSAELMAAVGKILIQDGMPEADDEDYARMCEELVTAADAVSLAIDQGDAAAAGRSVGAISQSCSACHEVYR